MQIQFRTNQILFNKKKVWFDPSCCDGCPGHKDAGSTPSTLPAGQPSCTHLKRSDFVLCGTCDATDDCGGAPAWTGVLNFDTVDTWKTASYPSDMCCPSGRKVHAHIVFTANLFTLTVTCDSGDVVWAGTKAVGDNPCGRYERTSGCDTTPLMQVG
jgi:hypothetical protein